MTGQETRRLVSGDSWIIRDSWCIVVGQSVLTYNHGQKSWDTFCISGVFSNSHMSSPNPTNNVGCVYPEFFRIQVSTL